MPVGRTLFWRVQGPRHQQAVYVGDWKLVMDGGRALLFDLHADIGERTNLIGKRSEVARRLRQELAEWQRDVNSEGKLSEAK